MHTIRIHPINKATTAFNVPNGPNLSFQRGLQTLLNFLSKVKVPGDVENQSEKVWVGDTFERLQCLENWRNDLGLVAESKAFLQGLKDANFLLARLQDSVVRATKALEMTLLPFEFGRALSSLPDNILSNIFEIVHAKCRAEPHLTVDRRSWTHLKLSLVSRRFRDIVSNSPRLWNSPEEDLAPNAIELFLAKSKGAGLKLWLDKKILRSDYNRRPPLYNLALPHSERWKDLSLSLGSTKKKTEKSFEILASLHLPRLDSLSIFYWPDKRPFQHFYKAWDLSSLRSLLICEVVPEPFNAPLLTTFTVDIDGGADDIRKLLNFLAANPTLEAIEISVNHSAGNTPTEGSVLLENVKTFTMRSRNIYLFMERICMPNVREVELRSVEAPSNSDSSRLDHVLWYENYPLLETFKLTEMGEHQSYFIPFHKTPNLRFLSLDTHSIRPHDLEHCRLPPIRELRIVCDIDRRWLRWLKGFHTLLAEQGKLSGFDKLTIYFPEEVWDSKVPIGYVLELNKLFGTSRTVWDGYHHSWGSFSRSASEMQFKVLH